MIIFIGAQHFFEICQEIDRVSLEKSAYSRVHEAVSHAGPALTITSLATCIAFAFGMLSSLEALRSFCMFAFMCTLMLYLCNMTFFLALVVWDTRRVEARKKDCFGACACSENSVWCCKGKLLSEEQRDFSGADEAQIHDVNTLIAR